LFKEVINTSSSKNIIDQLLKAINDGHLNPGENLPSERLLAEQFKVSRPVLREAISALSFLGIIQRKQGKGNLIANNLNRAILNSSFKYMIISKEKEIEDLLEARKTIECKLIRLATVEKTMPLLKKMEEQIAEISKCRDTDLKRVRLDLDFHFTIGKAASNSVLHNLQIAIADRVMEIMKVGVYLYPVANTALEHQMMYDAIKDSEPIRAERLMERHIEQLKIRHIGKLESIDGFDDNYSSMQI
jgi:GntR family transcriptional regulator, transcriptional repressor for pyruvate dehydrogenase complex